VSYSIEYLLEVANREDPATVGRCFLPNLSYDHQSDANSIFHRPFRFLHCTSQISWTSFPSSACQISIRWGRLPYLPYAFTSIPILALPIPEKQVYHLWWQHKSVAYLQTTFALSLATTNVIQQLFGQGSWQLYHAWVLHFLKHPSAAGASPNLYFDIFTWCSALGLCKDETMEAHTHKYLLLETSQIQRLLKCHVFLGFSSRYLYVLSTNIPYSSTVRRTKFFESPHWISSLLHSLYTPHMASFLQRRLQSLRKARLPCGPNITSPVVHGLGKDRTMTSLAISTVVSLLIMFLCLLENIILSSDWGEICERNRTLELLGTRSGLARQIRLTSLHTLSCLIALSVGSNVKAMR